ncbi:hypothetical protein CYMTET_51196 [Cymbomonas tetramitiformis]|uniref:Uncharacterized protein n=1 Tax=Cymbomonas tetramitiformis TaxID=36881 RepID=A0AAE0BLJ2_9CHLO|nr:hypothetical protein CYMTET_51196 [Cymbomonas tetramitiformis]
MHGIVYEVEAAGGVPKEDPQWTTPESELYERNKPHETRHGISVMPCKRNVNIAQTWRVQRNCLRQTRSDLIQFSFAGISAGQPTMDRVPVDIPGRSAVGLYFAGTGTYVGEQRKLESNVRHVWTQTKLRLRLLAMCVMLPPKEVSGKRQRTPPAACSPGFESAKLAERRLALWSRRH